MSLDFRVVHALEQLSGVAKEISDIAINHRQRLIDGGFPEELAARQGVLVEERLWAIVLQGLFSELTEDADSV